MQKTHIYRFVIVVVILRIATLATAAHACETEQAECDRLQQALQGKWQVYAVRDDPAFSEFAPPRWGTSYTKFYQGNSFSMFVYFKSGALLQSYSGEFEVISGNRIKETIRYYSPYWTRKVQKGYDGNIVLVSGPTMVGSTIETLAIIKEDELHLEGTWRQNLSDEGEIKSFGNMPVQQKYKRVLTTR